MEKAGTDIKRVTDACTPRMSEPGMAVKNKSATWLIESGICLYRIRHDTKRKDKKTKLKIQ